MEKKTVIINVETADGVKELDRLSAKFDEVYGDVLPLTGAIGELEDQLYQMAKAGETDSVAFKELAAEAGRLKKVVQQVDLEVDALSMTAGNKLGGALGGVTAGFELVQGAMGAMGAESEKVQEALLKVQSAMAIAQGVQGIKESIPAFKSFFSMVKGGFASMRAAIVSTGIGALIVGVGLLVSNWDKVKGSVDKASKSFTDYLNSNSKGAKATKFYLEQMLLPVSLLIWGFKKVRDAITGTSDASRKVAEVQERMSKERLKQLDEERAAQKKAISDMDLKIQLLEAEGKSTIELRKKKIALQKADAEGTLQALEFTKRMMGKNSVLSKSYDELIQNAKKVVNDIAIAEINLTKEVKTQNAERTRSRKEELDKQRDDQIAAWEKQKDETQKQVEELQMSRENNYKSEIDILYEQSRIKADLEKKARDEKKVKDDEQAAKDIQRAREVEAAKLDLASQGLSTLNDLIGAFAGKNEKQQKRAFEMQKAVSIAQAVIDTYKGANAIFASAAANPATVLFPAQPFIQAGLAVAAGIANVKKIASTQFGGSASASSGGGTSGGGSAPNIQSNPANFNIVGNSGVNQLAQGLANTPMQAYVVAGEVTTAQNMDRNRIKTATL